MLNHRLVRNLDFVLIAVTLLIIAISLIFIGSATHINSSIEDRYWYVQRQGAFALINIIVVFWLLHYDYKSLGKMAHVLYGINLVMLLAVMLIGQSALGAQRWIQIGPISLQPSEFSKLIMIISLAHILDKRSGQLNTMKDVLPIFIYVGIPFLLVLKQPDLGTALVFMAILFGMLFIAGIRMQLLGKIVGAGIAFLPIFWFFLKDYQKKRLTVFMDPGTDPLGSGYHIIQSKIAIGSGMLYGKGLFSGTQSQLNFLPENHTDFIFAVIGEEVGFIGSVLVLALYMLLLYRGVKIAGAARDNFGTLLAAGIVSMLAFHLLVNVGMTAGIMPVTGIPLPLMSYGISALTTNMVSLGILLNIYMRRQKIMF
ncbi:rod shape-determining protein RodA [Acetonema longum]|uniref:Peptidoglycan glycosyltransferase RodA n=1 Tax=Acetonema longum DSM 6540 TaxID=1009370 RepID=F7NHP4_9FIRM|nr:rod shape-determining protein RodA [Acetonema longum]EGO64419.1 rod shape-determining protein RodA [Acetonema longum DSM 6540]